MENNLILTGKIKKIADAIGQADPGVTHIEVKHQAGCPAIKTLRLADCTCDPTIERMGKC